jgi:uncharacterized coiled-coil DUF342 family protein
MSEDIKAVNARLRELNKEFQDLSALKKKLQQQNMSQNIKDKYGDYKFIVKRKENTPIDFDKLVNEGNCQIGQSIYGLRAIAYDLGKGKVDYHIAKTEEEANQIRVVEGLFNTADLIHKKVKENKKLSPQEILDLFDGARDGHQFEEPEGTEEIPQ